MSAAGQIETTFREEHGRILAALIAQLGDFALAEDALQDALVNALERYFLMVLPWRTKPKILKIPRSLFHLL